ncbi:MAG: hypothetical protein ACI8PZ_001244 [Myxococcota bacterium]
MTLLLLLACGTPQGAVDAPAPSRPHGVTDDVVRVGTVLPISGDADAARIGRAARDALVAALAGARPHGRRIELVVHDAPLGSGLMAAKALVAREDLFALVAPQIDGEEPALARWVAETGIPVVAPFGGEPETEPLSPALFWLYGGGDEQIRAVVHDLRGRSGAALVVGAEAGPWQRRSEVALAQSARSTVKLQRTTHAEACGALAGRGIDAVVLDGPAQAARQWMIAGSAEECPLDLWMLGELAPPVLGDGDIPWFGRVFVASPSRPRAWSPAGLAELRALVGDSGAEEMPVQVAAVVAAKLLVEGLELAGPELDRERFVVRLGGLQEFRTGLTPRVSFGAARRVGALGAWMVERDPRTAAALGGADAERWVVPR